MTALPLFGAGLGLDQSRCASTTSVPLIHDCPPTHDLFDANAVLFKLIYAYRNATAAPCDFSFYPALQTTRKMSTPTFFGDQLRRLRRYIFRHLNFYRVHLLFL